MLIPSLEAANGASGASLSRRVNANSQLLTEDLGYHVKLIKKGEC